MSCSFITPSSDTANGEDGTWCKRARLSSPLSPDAISNLRVLASAKTIVIEDVKNDNNIIGSNDNKVDCHGNEV